MDSSALLSLLPRQPDSASSPWKALGRSFLSVPQMADFHFVWTHTTRPRRFFCLCSKDRWTLIFPLSQEVRFIIQFLKVENAFLSFFLVADKCFFFSCLKDLGVYSMHCLEGNTLTVLWSSFSSSFILSEFFQRKVVCVSLKTVVYAALSLIFSLPRNHH